MPLRFCVLGLLGGMAYVRVDGFKEVWRFVGLEWSHKRQPNKTSCLANPLSPDSIPKRPEPQICPKVVSAIVFEGSSRGD